MPKKAKQQARPEGSTSSGIYRDASTNRRMRETMELYGVSLSAQVRDYVELYGENLRRFYEREKANRERAAAEPVRGRRAAAAG